MLGTILIILLILALLGGLPTWGWHGTPYAWGAPGLLVIILVIVLLTGFGRP